MHQPAAPLNPVNPWFSIWTEPRATVRHLVQTDPGRNVVLLAALGGIGQSLSQAMGRGAGDQFSLPAILLLAVLIGSLFGVLALYAGGWLVQWTGRWIGGEGSREHIRTALGWANVPLVAGLVLTLAVLAFTGTLLFQSEDALAAEPVGVGAGLILLIYGVATVVLGIWSFVILLKGLGEVQSFSAWRAWGNVLLAGAVVLVPVVVLGIVAALLIPRLAGA